ncbi:MAG: type III secretion system chaperone [Lachnospiraceae bacterium]|nr:type III secretion system chaperone [Lachnospiraceae bacterium]
MLTMGGYKAFLAAVRKDTGLDMLIPDEDGLVTVRVEDQYGLGLQYVEAAGKVLCFIEVARLPEDAPKAVYRDLLAGGLFGQETSGGYFTLEPGSESVIYNYFFDGEEAARDPEDFVATLEKMLQLCDIWNDRISGHLRNAMEGKTPHNSHALFA